MLSPFGTDMEVGGDGRGTEARGLDRQESNRQAPSAPVLESDEHGPILGVEGFLEGVDSMGIIVLSSPRDASGRRGLLDPRTDMPPRHVFYPWPRVHLIERSEAENAQTEPPQ